MNKDNKETQDYVIILYISELNYLLVFLLSILHINPYTDS